MISIQFSGTVGLFLAIILIIILIGSGLKNLRKDQKRQSESKIWLTDVGKCHSPHGFYHQQLQSSHQDLSYDGDQDTQHGEEHHLQHRLDQQSYRKQHISSDRIKVASWVLEDQDGTEISFINNLESQRTVVDRCRVETAGDFSGVVEIHAFFRDEHGDQYNGWGTAVVLDSTTLMTVAHNVFHENHAAHKVTFCFDERAQIQLAGDFRAVAIAASYNYISRARTCNDFALVQVDPPLNLCNVRPLPIKKAPASAENVTVYGYPYDMPIKDGKRLSHLCECHARTSIGFDRNGLVEHTGDTQKGNSGGPLVTQDSAIIALHRGWGTCHLNSTSGLKAVEKTDDNHLSPKLFDSRHHRNKAVPINHHGNDVEQFQHVLRSSMARHRDQASMRPIAQGERGGMQMQYWSG